MLTMGPASDEEQQKDRSPSLTPPDSQSSSLCTPISTPATSPEVSQTASFSTSAVGESTSIKHGPLKNIGDEKTRKGVETLTEIDPDCTIDRAVELLEKCKEGVSEVAFRLIEDLPQQVSEFERRVAREQRYPGGQIPLPIQLQPTNDNMSNSILPTKQSSLDIIDLTGVDSDNFEPSVLEDISFRRKIEQLHDMLPFVPMGECQKILQLCKGNVLAALNTLVDKGCGPEGWEEDQDENDDRQSHREYPMRSSGPRGKNNGDIRKRFGSRKRAAESPDRRVTKKSRVVEIEDDNDEEVEEGRSSSSNKDDDADDNDDDNDDETEAEVVSLEDWIKTNWSEKSELKIIVGLEEVVRDTIPMEIYSKFERLNDIFESRPSVGSSTIEIKLPDIDPNLFDLAIQLVASRHTHLSFVPGASRAEQITTIIKVISEAQKLGSHGRQGAVEVIVDKLRGLLVTGRRKARDDLTITHIAMAYKLPKGHCLRKLCVDTAVRPRLEWREPEMGDSSDEDENDEEDEMDEAHRARKGGYRFMYQTAIEKIPDFKSELMDKQEIVRTKRTWVKLRKKTRNIDELWGNQYIDPLTGDKFHDY